MNAISQSKRPIPGPPAEHSSDKQKSETQPGRFDPGLAPWDNDAPDPRRQLAQQAAKARWAEWARNKAL